MKCKKCGGEGYWTNPFDERFRCECMKKRNKMSENVQSKMTMSDGQMYELLTMFANQHPCVAENDAEIIVSAFSTSLKSANGIKFEDAQQLDRDINGALRFLLWARRNRVVHLTRKKV